MFSERKMRITLYNIKFNTGIKEQAEVCATPRQDFSFLKKKIYQAKFVIRC